MQGESGSAEGFQSVVLTSADGSTSAEFVPAVNMLCCSFRVDGDELLERGRGVRTYAELGKTMGIPLMYPWANRLDGFGYRAAGKRVTLPGDDPRIPRDSGGLPIHGVLPSLLRWEVRGGGAGDSLEASLDWRSEELLALFPFPHDARVEAVVGRGELAITTTVTAAADGPVPVSFGYHPYARVPGADRDGWLVAVGASHRLALDERGIPTGERTPIDRRSFALAGVSLDDAFDASSPPATFTAAAAGITLSVEFLSGYPFAQVFAPGGQQFICFEPMTAPANALNSGDGLTVLAPGESHRAAFRISLSRGD